MFELIKKSIPRPFLFLAAAEIALLVACFYLGALVSWPQLTFSIGFLESFFGQALIFAGVFLVAMFAMGLYEGLLTSSVASILARLVMAFLAGFIALSALFYAVPEFATWRAVTGAAILLGFLAVAVTHLIVLKLVDLVPFKRRVLVLGVGKLAKRLQDLEQRGQAYGFTVVGFVETPNSEKNVDRGKIVPRPNSLLELVKQRRAEEIVIADEAGSKSLPIDQLVDCSFRGVPILDYLAFCERETKRTDLDSLEESWILTAGGLPGGMFHHAVMRVFDISVSAMALVALLPVIVGTAIAIKLDSPGPVFYRQTRVGLRGKPFALIKFRSMRTDAEADGTPRWSSGEDPRVTAIGGFIRKTRIDEIPQIFNVLRGNMKFVGPRPERPFFVEQLAKEIPFYMQRFQVKPGITGWAQLHYPYAASADDSRDKLEYDLYYIKNYSLMLDLIIVLQTVRVIFWPHRMSARPIESRSRVEEHRGGKTSLPLQGT